MITTIATYVIVGSSMLHMGFDNGDTIKAIPAPCPEQSVIVFKYENEETDHTMFIKQLMYYGYDGCIYVKGRDGYWWEGDKITGKRKQSLDSKIWGCIPTEDYSIIGCVL